MLRIFVLSKIEGCEITFKLEGIYINTTSVYWYLTLKKPGDEESGSGWSFTASQQVSHNKKEDSPATLVCIVAILFDTALATLLTLSAVLLC